METIDQKRARRAENTRRYRLKHPERLKGIRKTAYNNRKIKAFLLVGGAVCRNCGCDEISFLEFNHKNGGGAKEYKAAQYMSMMDQILTKKRITSDLECLCRVCNALDYLKRKHPEQVKNFNVSWTKKCGS